MKLVEDYQRRRLTKEPDRIMAFSGIARAFTSRHKLTYVAGLFVEHMPAALLWFNPSKRNDSNSSLQQDRHAIAPSWLWFSTPVSIVQTFSSWIDLKTYQGMQRVATTSFAWNEKATRLRPSEAFHNFTGLEMTLKAPAFAATTSYPNTSLSRMYLDDHRSLHEYHYVSSSEEPSPLSTFSRRL